MNKYPTYKLQLYNLGASLLLSVILWALSIHYMFIGCLAISGFIIARFCEKNNLLKRKESIFKVAIVSFVCALPWLLFVIISTSDISHLTNRKLLYAILFCLSWLKDFTTTMLTLPKKPCETEKKHVPYWLLIVIFFSISYVTIFQDQMDRDISFNKSIGLTSKVQESILAFFIKEKRFPRNNEEIGFKDTPDSELKGVISIAVQPKGIIAITYDKRLFSYPKKEADNVIIYLKVTIKDNDIFWKCFSVIGLLYENKSLPKDCGDDIRNYREEIE